MIISSFNIQNDVRNYKNNKSINIFNYIKKYNIDIIGLQELTYKYNNEITKLIKNYYSIVGKYRYFFKLLSLYKNEKNPIISKYTIISNKTYHLPSNGSKYKRILTHAVIIYKNSEISIYNTHLELYDKNIKEKQLNYIFNIIKDDRRPIILMGDFNSKIDSDVFNNFILKMKNIGINRVCLKGNTYINSNDNMAIDHIFISEEFSIKKKKIMDNIKFSDHYPILVDLELKKME